jgi:hypothetical protein
MADIRIKDLATTAASTASDDFVAVDGSANGTRKLNAYSPTFGGNLTVGGTISSSGVVDFAVSANSTQVFTFQNTSTGASAATRLTMVAGASSGSIQLYGSGHTTPNILQFSSPSSQKWLNNGVEVMSLSSAGNLTVSGTGNSSVAGNLGLGTTSPARKLSVGGTVQWGNLNFPGFNGYLTEASTNSSLFPAITRNLIGSTGNTYTIANGELGAYRAIELGTNFRFFGADGTFTTGESITPTELMRLTYTGNLLLKSDGVDGGQKLQVTGNAYISSTLTVNDIIRSSGATNTIRVRGNSQFIDFTNLAESAYVTGTIIANTLNLQGNNGTGLSIGTTGDATFAGAIAIGNTVNTVSPTSPNRTITMVIGGTTYYIHAKTTND